jgi:hypothetical protein
MWSDLLRRRAGCKRLAWLEKLLYYHKIVMILSQPFVVSGILEENIATKVAIENTGLLRDALNDHLNLSTYGTGLRGISFFFIVTAPEDKIHHEYTRYSSKERELHLQLRLPYETVLHASREEVLLMMVHTYLNGLKNYLPKKKIQDFDTATFLRDVERFFAAQGWLQEAEA